jgi:anti-anti-sigma factor
MNTREWFQRATAQMSYECLGVGVAVHAMDGALRFVNPAGLELWGWTGFEPLSLQAWIARLGAKSMTPSAAEGHPVQAVIQGRAQAEGEISVVLPNDLRRTLRVIARNVMDEAGQRAAIVQTFFDNGEAVSARGAVRDLVEQSTPVLTVGDKLILQPLIGTLDSDRASQAMEKLLETIGKTGSKVAIVDITGVSAVDTATANHLLRSLAAARLLGCEVVLSGVSPPIARTITLLGLDLSALRTKRDVAAAIEFGRRWVEASDALPSGDATVGNTPRTDDGSSTE